MKMRQPTRAAMATAAFLSGRVGAFVSSGGLRSHGGIRRVAAVRCLSMAADQEKVGFIGESTCRGRHRVLYQLIMCQCFSSTGVDLITAVYATAIYHTTATLLRGLAVAAIVGWATNSKRWWCVSREALYSCNGGLERRGYEVSIKHSRLIAV